MRTKRTEYFGIWRVEFGVDGRNVWNRNRFRCDEDNGRSCRGKQSQHSNGNLVIAGGTLDITAQSPFDYDGTCEKTGGTLIINGTETDSVTNQMMGGGHGGKGGFGGWSR